LSHAVSTRSSRLFWTGLGFSVLMVMGLLGAHQRAPPEVYASRHDMAVTETVMVSAAKNAQHLAEEAQHLAGEVVEKIKPRETIQERLARGYEDARAWAKQGRDDHDCRVSGKCKGGRCVDDQCVGPKEQRDTKRAAEQEKKDALAKARHKAEQAKKDALEEAKRVADKAKKDAQYAKAEAERIAEGARKDGQNILAKTKRIADRAKKDGQAEAGRIADEAKKEVEQVHAEAKLIADRAKEEGLAEAKRIADREREKWNPTPRPKSDAH